MTKSTIPALSLKDVPVIEAAVIGGVLIASHDGAHQLLRAYQPEDITEPRLQVVDRLARILVAKNQRPTAPAVVAEAIDGGHVDKQHQTALTLLLMDLIDVNLNPDSRVAQTYVRHIVFASVRRRIATAATRIEQSAADNSLTDLAIVSRSESDEIRSALNRLESMGGETQ